MHRSTSLTPRLAMALAACLSLLAPITAHAALTISSTRVIQPSDRQSTSIVVANPTQRPYAAQAWINTEADDNTTAVPLIASPALFRIDPTGEQTVQFNRLPNNLPQDRESVFYFNLQEIPQADDKPSNSLTIALRTRIKVFYRPTQLKGRPQDHLQSLAWSVQTLDGKPHLVVDNPSPYYFTFNQLILRSTKGSEKIDARKMAIPMGRQTYPLKTSTVQDGLKVEFTTINDYGGLTPELSRPAGRS
ncbi:MULTISPECIES: molecular chaperone [Pseudomonas]|uniref:fimbrial biogenesis chaperone n=1 Tax=Pseudomonas TaxID=286 RepID=UPI0018E6C11F|nr:MULTISPECIES: molecular chaperone [Pseudomonas]MBI6919742.1 molecular chaperone [Pseudomonas monteilii]MCE0940663.1 molecular chaperone [Pseudomonas kurunegalensis]